MTRLEFTAECETRLIDVDVALEDAEVVQALRDQDDSRVLAALDNNF